MSDVLAWAKQYERDHNIQALANLTGIYNRTTISLYLSGKYPAGVAAIENVLRPLMTKRHCPFLTVEISAKDCANRQSRPRPHGIGGAMQAHWQACQTCIFNTKGETT